MRLELRYFCTLFDSGYLLKGVAMLKSLAIYCPGAKVFVLCMDEQTQAILKRLALDFVTCIPLCDIEDDALLAAKKDRGVAEYCWTLSPCLPWHVLQRNSEIDFITYLDADLLFFSPVQPLYDEIGGASIAIIEHRFTPRLKDREVNGRFCVEWVSFRRDEEGMACLLRWREQCIEWCYYRLEEGRMGDQKYLDEWPLRYAHCHILQHPGAGIAPWNYAQYQFDCDLNGNVIVENAPLIFYHFHQFQLLNNGSFDRLSNFYASEQKEPDRIYQIYEKILIQILREIRIHYPGFSEGMKSPAAISLRRMVQAYVPHFIKNAIRRIISM
ncbi:MAG: hypothetical protein HY847_12610 [Betaproteobacteria bacterium]|nr:hypothetical protein [Betaproteobacteria bacterium]